MCGDHRWDRRPATSCDGYNREVDDMLLNVLHILWYFVHPTVEPYYCSGIITLTVDNIIETLNCLAKPEAKGAQIFVHLLRISFRSCILLPHWYTCSYTAVLTSEPQGQSRLSASASSYSVMIVPRQFSTHSSVDKVHSLKSIHTDQGAPSVLRGRRYNCVSIPSSVVEFLALVNISCSCYTSPVLIS